MPGPVGGDASGREATIRPDATTEGRCVGSGLGEQLATGSRSAVYAWGRDAVAKVPFESTPEEWILFEAHYTSAVRHSGAPAPRFLGIETIAGRAASIYERVDGSSMWEHMIEQPARVPAYARSLAELQAHLFALVPSVSLPVLGDRLTCKIRRAAALADPALVAALELVGTSTPSRLCHGDLHPGNVIMSSAGPVLIDWFDAARGAPIADVARTSLLLSARAHGVTGPSHLPGSDPKLLDLARTAYLDAMADLLDLDRDALRRWEAVVAVARVAEGIATSALLAIWHDWRTGSEDEPIGARAQLSL